MLVLIGLGLLAAFLVSKYLDKDLNFLVFIIGIAGFVWVLNNYQKYDNVLDMFLQIK